jgi:GntR family transcriptional regulator
VSEGGSPFDRRERLRIITERVDGVLVEARQLGFELEEVVTLVRERDAALRPPLDDATEREAEARS